MFGVTIGDKHSYSDFGILMSSKVISPPEPKINKVSIPLRDGSIDLTESLTDDVKFEERKITITCKVIDPIEQWNSKVSEISNYLHGKTKKIVFDDDAEFYYIGRLKVNEWTSNKNIGTLVIEGTVDPYKYDVNGDWLWDSFDFENGCINEPEEVRVSGTASVVVVGRRKQTYPTITASAAMTVQFEGVTYNLAEGVNKIYDIIIKEGENMLTFTGTGTVVVDYEGGSL